MKRYVILISMILGMVSFAMAQPVWNVLEQMSPQERANAEIEITLEKGANLSALQMAQNIGDLWNDGNMAEALALFPQLSGLTDAREIAIGYTWRTPVSNPQTRWENEDWQVGSRDSISTVSLFSSDFVDTLTTERFDTLGYWWTEDDTVCYDTDAPDSSIMVDSLHDGFAYIYDIITNYFGVFFIEGDGIVNRWTIFKGINTKIAVLEVDSTAAWDSLYFFEEDENKIGENPVWAEVYNWVAGYPFNTNSAVLLDYYIYVGYSRGTSQDQANIRRFSIEDGGPVAFSDESAFLQALSVDSPDSIKEITLVSNHHNGDNTIYITAITTAGNILCYSSDTACASWTEITTGVTNADRGLDVTYDGDSGELWASYIDNTDSLQIDNDWVYSQSNATGTSALYTSIAAYDDTITCVFDYTASGADRVQYFASFDGGTSWEVVADLDGNTNISRSADIIGYPESGFGVAYNYTVNDTILNGQHTWRDDAGGWSTPPGTYTTHAHYYKPAVDYLGTYELSENNIRRVFGVVYIMDDIADVRTAYFDYGDIPEAALWVDDKVSNVPEKFTLMQNYPNPFNASTIIKYSLTEPTNIKIDVFDILGRKVTTLIDEYQPAGMKQITWNASDKSSGVYFYQVKTDDKSETKRMLLLK